ncbi:hypothetical protein SCHPADRAFT_405807 [Schizopora paradoxa]|uniref:Uncharacterized protein n=1 Tax=Schizopora paradoxa TaxID=27342 RepID=A0A0H2RT97_9AGAM|nr:hypothetical protein SCHPADRAFT_405807 [Schizopora paradoxa]
MIVLFRHPRALRYHQHFVQFEILCTSSGMGKYSSSISSKSNGHSAYVTPSKYRAVLLIKVVEGKAYKSASCWEQFPEIGAGADELIVFSDDAIRP